MVAVKLSKFGGMIPALDSILLPPNQASNAENTWVYTGAVEPIKTPTLLYTPVNPLARKVYRIPKGTFYDKAHLNDSAWLEFLSPDVDIIHSPTAQDSFERFYWAGAQDGGALIPSYNTKARILAGQAPFLLGIPQPTVAPLVTRLSGKYFLQATAGLLRLTGGAAKLYYELGFARDGSSFSSGAVDGLGYAYMGRATGVSSLRGSLDASPSPPPTSRPRNQLAIAGQSTDLRYLTANLAARVVISDTGAPTLGVPTTPAPATSSDPYQGLGLQEARAYVYTWVSAYGEESAPSPATLYNGWTSDPWVLKLTPPDASITTNRNLATTRIYRTVTSVGGPTTYFFVAEVAIATTSYIDSATSDVISQNLLLQSSLWTPPPSDLVGMSLLPNGIIAGWRANEIWFCEPYRPHAWPVSYVVPVEYPIIGFGVIGQSLIVCTTGNPYTVSGINPASMSVSRIASYEPCLSRGSIVSSAAGVAYASANGVAVAVPGEVQVVTLQVIARDQWMDFVTWLNVPSLRAVALNGGYYCWGSTRAGCFTATAFDNSSFLLADYSGAYKGAFIDISNRQVGATPGAFVDPSASRVGYTTLTSVVPMSNVFSDHWTGEPFLIYNSAVYWLDLSEAATPGSFKWRSKTLNAPDARNFAAMRIYFGSLPGIQPPQGSVTTARVYADGRLVWTRPLLTSGEICKLPSGFRATYWEIEIEGQVSLKSIEFATTAKELQTV